MHLAAHQRTSVVALLASLPAEEWDVWLAYSERFPLGPRQDDFRSAVVAAAFGGKDVLDLFPSLKPPPDKSGRSFRLWALSRAPAYRPGGEEGSAR